MKDLKKAFYAMSSNQQLFFVLVVGFLAYFAFQWVTGKKKAFDQAIKAKTEVQTLKEMGVKASYSLDKYKAFADGLFESMDGPGTDEARIIRIFSYLHNNLDFIELEKAFGIREYSAQIIGTGSDMKSWLRKDLDGGVIRDINSGLKNQGVSKQI